VINIKLNIYLAGSIKERDICRILASKIENTGHTIIVDWWNHIEQKGKLYSEIDCIGVRRCDLLILHNLEEASFGKMFEFGMAFALGKTVILVGKEPNVVFKHKINMIFSTEYELLKYLKEIMEI
jgi:nucleoside 2-deoxyribosyltransferase